MSNIQIKIEGMTCGGCAESVTNALQQCRGVNSVNVDHVSGLAQIDYDPQQISVQELKTAIEDTGFDVIN